MKTFDEVFEAMGRKEGQSTPPEWMQKYESLRVEMEQREEVSEIATDLLRVFIHPTVRAGMSDKLLDLLVSAIASGFTTGVMVGMEMEKQR